MTCLVSTSKSKFRPGDADGHPIVCGDDFAAVGPVAPPQLFNKTTEFVAETACFVTVDLWGGGGGGTGSVKMASSEDTTMKAYVCGGGGGGGGAHVRALVELQAGETYRIEPESGGLAGRAGRAAQNG